MNKEEEKFRDERFSERPKNSIRELRKEYNKIMQELAPLYCEILVFRPMFLYGWLFPKRLARIKFLTARYEQIMNEMNELCQ